MGVNLRNSDGYIDPTPYQALTNILNEERKTVHAYWPVVYICSPYAGDVAGNVAAARRYSRYAVDRGFIPIAPHLLFPQFMEDNDPRERELGMFFGNVLMGKCAEVWVFGRKISPGMQMEISRAQRKNYRLRYFTEDLKETGQNADADQASIGGKNTVRNREEKK